jgi:hypothetical protein
MAGVRDAVDRQTTVITRVSNTVDQQSVVRELEIDTCLPSDSYPLEYSTPTVVPCGTGQIRFEPVDGDLPTPMHPQHSGAYLIGAR